jgi:DHA3 family macrolide efflux protein-like MFS transporter
MVMSDVLSGAVTLALAAYAFLAPKPQVWVLALAGFCLSTVASFFRPARTAAIPRLVPQDQVLEANALAVSTGQLVIMGAQAFSVLILGGIQKLYPSLFFALSALLNSMTFFASAWFLSGLPLIQPSLEGREESGMLDEIRQGFSAVKEDGFMGPALIVSCIFHIFISGWMVIYVRTNSAWFGGEYWTLSLVELSFFVVLAVTSLMVGRMTIRRIGWFYFWGNFVTGALCLLMAWATNYPLYLLLNALCGVTVAFVWLPMASYIQTAFPDELRGRVSSLWNMVQQGSQPFGFALVGPVIASIGLVGMYVLMGVGMMGAALVGIAFKGMRQGRMPLGQSEGSRPESA